MITHNSRPLAEAAAPKLNLDKGSMPSQADMCHQDKNPTRTDLEPRHRHELHSSAISDKVIDGRGYRSVLRTDTDLRHQNLLKNNGMAKAVWGNVQLCSGILMPQWSVAGERLAGMYKPDRPRTGDKGKPRKYEAPAGRTAVLDVHPFNTGRLSDPAVDLWVTEGVKKGDALTSADECAVALAGVWNWRNKQGPLGDWESVQLRGRIVYVCFDSDTWTNPSVRGAMRRLGQFLTSKGAIVRYVVPPSVVGDAAKVGVDDYLNNGGTVAELKAMATRRPFSDPVDGSATDAVMAQRVADEALCGEYRHVPALGWLAYDGARWREVGEEVVVEAVRCYVLQLSADAAEDRVDSQKQKNLLQLQSAARLMALVKLARGIPVIRADVADFDADPWLLNCANGVVDLRSGELTGHCPEQMMRHCTDVAFIDEATHPDWDLALGALPDADVQDYVRQFFGTGATGFAFDDLACVFAGGGSNGKSTILNGCAQALGSYARVLAPSVLGGGQDHATDAMELLGARLVYLEETGPNQRLDTNKIKRLVGTPVIKARALYKAPVEFSATHTLALTTNNLPTVTETDHGTWRRLRLVPFDVTYPDATKDVTLRDRVLHDPEVQEAVLAWMVSGARDWFRSGRRLPAVPASISAATKEWREEGDLLFSFLPRYLVSDPAGFVELRTLLEAFNLDLPLSQHPWGQASFRSRVSDHPAMKDLGAVWGKHPTTRRSGYLGVRRKRY